MKAQAENPAIIKYGHLLPANGLYPAKWVDIFSRKNSEYKISDVEAVFIPRNEINGPPEENQEFWGKYSAYNKRWDADLGNSCVDWMQPDGLTPSFVFGYFLRCGFADKSIFHMALREFAQIQECEWAREMLAGYNRG